MLQNKQRLRIVQDPNMHIPTEIENRSLHGAGSKVVGASLFAFADGRVRGGVVFAINVGYGVLIGEL